ncbi:hypothetical protein TREES_T100014090 [Tupaia chinensis]|uniref:Uncharacterized protein n=1 Tax=Tupaia chinensis TaxID=246437 RepID=L9KQ20_TUPCH|nr:hypothetical protein TREES_T100014090 [Tupaia chinensis]
MRETSCKWRRPVDNDTSLLRSAFWPWGRQMDLQKFITLEGESRANIRVLLVCFEMLSLPDTVLVAPSVMVPDE